MDLSSKTDSINKLKSLINNGKDKEAYDFFKDLFFKYPLVDTNGGDTELGEICNSIGHVILHASQQWQREVEWWKAVINTLEEYDRVKNIQLHKGLAYHNVVLPLLELNLPKTAVKYEQKAIKEDFRNFDEAEAKRRPAYKLGCFLIPIVMTHRWQDNDSKISQGEIRQLIDSFEVMFDLTSNNNRFLPMPNTLQNITDEDLKTTLLKRYESIERNLENDAVIVAIYAGSVIEGLLTVLLKERYEQSIREFRNQAEQRPSFIFYLHDKNKICDVLPIAIDQKAPRQGSEEVQKRAIDSWEFNLKIEIARILGLFGKPEQRALFILCHLLREYRNIIHPSNKDAIGLDKEWEITFKLEPQIAHMLKGALDIVLTLLPQNVSSSISTSPFEEPVMGSPGIPGDPDEDNASSVVSKSPDSTQTYVRTISSSSPAMGSTTTTTLPNIEDKQGKV